LTYDEEHALSIDRLGGLKFKFHKKALGEAKTVFNFGEEI